MEMKGFVDSNWDSPDKRGKRVYRITPKGTEAVPYMKKQVMNWLATLRVFIDAIQEQFKES
jgi:DNA-binding PadR family transcriptional regulator